MGLKFTAEWNPCTTGWVIKISTGEVDTRMTEMWKIKLPLEIKVFLWMLWHNNRVLTGDQRKIRRGEGSGNCKYRGKFETS